MTDAAKIDELRAWLRPDLALLLLVAFPWGGSSTKDCLVRQVHKKQHYASLLLPYATTYKCGHECPNLDKLSTLRCPHKHVKASLGDGMIIVTSVESNLQIVILMKNALVAFMLLLSLDIYAQGELYDPQNELRGNGKPVQLTKPTKPFMDVEIRPFPAEITIDAGANESVVAVTIDENLRPFLRIDDEGGKLILSFEHPQGKPFWINSSIIKINIKTPELKGLTYRSNSKLVVNNLRGELLDFANQGNATVTLQGSIKTMNLTNLANGSVDAEKLTTQKTNVVSRANGSVRIYAKDVSLVNTGRGSLVNVADSLRKNNK